MFERPLILHMKCPFLYTIYPQSTKFVTGVGIKATGDFMKALNSLFSNTKCVNKLHRHKEFRIVVRKGEFLLQAFKISPDH